MYNFHKIAKNAFHSTNIYLFQYFNNNLECVTVLFSKITQIQGFRQKKKNGFPKISNFHEKIYFCRKFRIFVRSRKMRKCSQNFASIYFAKKCEIFTKRQSENFAKKWVKNNVKIKIKRMRTFLEKIMRKFRDKKVEIMRKKTLKFREKYG